MPIQIYSAEAISNDSSVDKILIRIYYTYISPITSADRIFELCIAIVGLERFRVVVNQFIRIKYIQI